MSIKKNKLFNPQADDSISKRTIIKGESTGLFNLGEVKYPWTKQMYQIMVGNLETMPFNTANSQMMNAVPTKESFPFLHF